MSWLCDGQSCAAIMMLLIAVMTGNAAADTADTDADDAVRTFQHH